MRWKQQGEVRRVDLGPALRLAPVAAAVWRGLRFDDDGRLLHGVTDRPVDGIRLASGRHGDLGATYVFDLDILAPPKAAATGQQRPPRPRGTIRWVTLRHDGGDRVHGRLEDEHGRWSLEIDARTAGSPTASLTWFIDLSAVARATNPKQYFPPFAADRFLGRSHGEAKAAFEPLSRRDGRVLEAKGRLARSASGALTVDVAPGPSSWTVTADGSLRPRGFGRVVALAVGRRIRRAGERKLRDLFATADANLRELEADLADLSDHVNRAGGERAWVEQRLWRALDPAN